MAPATSLEKRNTHRRKSMEKIASEKKIWNILLATLIVLIGFLLRIYHLGYTSFWNDEAEQALTAIQPTLNETLARIQQHTMAMPLDYMVTKLIVHFSVREEVLRFPAVLWGTLSIIANYLLIQMTSTRNRNKIALLAVLFLSLSPVHIEYSQEMRFYASLFFFYSLANLLLFIAFKYSNWKLWIGYTVATAIGSYFHPYVLLVIVNGFLYLVAVFWGWIDLPSDRKYKVFSAQIDSSFVNYAISTVALFMIFLPGYLYFGSNETYNFTLTEYARLDWSLMVGLGWRAKHILPGIPEIGIWHILQIIGAVMGVFFVVTKHERYRITIILLLGTIAQVLILVGLCLYKNFFFSPRQIIHLTPIFMYLSAIGFIEAVTGSGLKEKNFRFAALILISLLIFGSSLPYIQSVYAYDKGDMKSISQKIIQNYRPREVVAIIGDSYPIEFYLSDYYLSRVGDNQNIVLLHLNWDNVSQLSGRKIRYLILSPGFTSGQQETIKNLGFTLVAGHLELLYLRTGE
jgi:uncharacterized membrane protein